MGVGATIFAALVRMVGLEGVKTTDHSVRSKLAILFATGLFVAEYDVCLTKVSFKGISDISFTIFLFSIIPIKVLVVTSALINVIKIMNTVFDAAVLLTKIAITLEVICWVVQIYLVMAVFSSVGVVLVIVSAHCGGV